MTESAAFLKLVLSHPDRSTVIVSLSEHEHAVLAVSPLKFKRGEVVGAIVADGAKALVSFRGRRLVWIE